jgi:hypothetical protein
LGNRAGKVFGIEIEEDAGYQAGAVEVGQDLFVVYGLELLHLSDLNDYVLSNNDIDSMR